MSSLVVVAIPSEDDRVWKVSSEKIPHLTLLYLGNSSNALNVDRMVEFLDHASSTVLTRFGLDVDHRGTLGSDQADVLFFSEGWEAKEVKRFRHFLLQNNDIRKAYDSSEQHPDWTPHLTLGYPDTPAKPNPDDYGISWVRFDRIALWLGNYEGPTFPLKTNELMEVSMSTAVDDVLAHYGKKGMKWGVRNSDVSAKTLSTDAKKAAKAQEKAKTKGSQSLTNNELKILTERIRLEKQLKDLSPDTKTAGKKFVSQHMKQVAGMAIGAAASKYVIKHI